MARKISLVLAPALCVFALVMAAPAAAGPTRTLTTPPRTIGGTTFTSETVEENFGTADKPDWKRIETRETKETPQSGQSTTVDRVIEIRKFAKGSRRATEKTTITEVEQPVFSLDPTIKKRKTETTTYHRVGGKRKKLKEVVEEWEVVEVTEFGEVFAEGTRVTKTHGPKGTQTTNEVMDRSGRWKPAPTPKKADASQAPLDAQRQGLPTSNPGQRGVVPHVPNQPGYGNKPTPKPSLPKY